MNNKVLLGVFGLLLVLFLASKLFTGNKSSSFDPQIVLVDTSNVDQIILYPKGQPGQFFTLKRMEAGNWVAENESLKVDAVTSSITSLLNQLTSIRAKRIVSKSPDKWTGYEVDEASGTRVEVKSEGKTLEDFIVGAFKYDQTNQSASSYIRKTREDEVYVVDGFLSMSFNQQFNNFRNKLILQINQDDVTEIRFQKADESDSYQKINNQWLFRGMEEVDSTLMAEYLTGLANVSGFDFVDQFTPEETQLIQRLGIGANNQMEEMVISLYRSNDVVKPFIIHSTMNPDAYFLSDSTGVYQKVFGKLSDLRSE